MKANPISAVFNKTLTTQNAPVVVGMRPHNGINSDCRASGDVAVSMELERDRSETSGDPGQRGTAVRSIPRAIQSGTLPHGKASRIATNGIAIKA